MNTDDAAKLIAGLISLNGSQIQLLTTIQSRRKWSQQANLQVGNLGKVYVIVVGIPQWIHGVMIVLTLLLSLVALLTGAMVLKGLQPYQWMRWLFDNSILIGVFYTSVLVMPIHFNLLSQGLLFIAKSFDHFRSGSYSRFDPGWVNADWQLNYYKEFFAANTNVAQCERVANSIFHLIRAQKAPQLYEQAPRPEDIGADELANYILFKCAIESCIHQFYPHSRTVLDDSHKYLLWAAKDPRHIFEPSKLREYAKSAKSGKSFYSTLRDLATGSWPANDQPQGSLADNSVIDRVVQNVLKRLVDKFGGHGSRLATDILHPKGFPLTLLHRLEKFERFDGPEGEALRNLYLKLCVRMEVWPDMTPGPFLYPYSNLLTIFLLNSHCLIVPTDVKAIEVDRGIRALAVSAEHRIVESCYDAMLRSAADAETVQFSNAVFQCKPQNVNRWKFSDYIDLWLWGHARQYCQHRSNTVSGSKLGCPAVTGANEPCYCDAIASPWRLEGRLLTRD